jgi:hypothetical protein
VLDRPSAKTGAVAEPAPSGSTPPPGPDGRRALGIVALLTTAVGLLVFHDAVLGAPDMPGRFDIPRYFAPLAHVFDRALAAGDFPTWLPHLLAGTPYVANPQASALYPPQIVRGLIAALNPTPGMTAQSLAVLQFLHVVWMGVGCARLARAHGSSWTGAAVAAIGCAWSALMVRRLAEYHYLFTLCWVPWLLVFGRQVLLGEREPGGPAVPRARAAIFLGLSYGVAILGGFPHLYLHMGVVLVLYLASVRLLQTPPEALLREGRRDALLGGVALVITLGIGVALLLPAFELLGLTPRAADSGLVATGNQAKAIGLRYVWNTLAVYGGEVFEKEGLRGAGALLLGLAVAALALGRRRHVLPLAIVVYAMLDVATETLPLARLLALVTPFQAVSPTRAFDVAIFAVAVLGGLGVDALLGREAVSAERARWPRYGLALLLAVAALASLAVVTGQASYWLKVSRPLVLGAPLLGLMAFFARGLLGPGRRDRLALPLAALGVVALVVELFAWNDAFVPRLITKPGYDKQWVAATRYSGEEPLWRSNQRGGFDDGNFHLYGVEPALSGYDPVYIGAVRDVVGDARRSRAYHRSLKAREVFQRNMRGSLFLKRFFWLTPHVVEGALPRRQDAFPPTQVTFVEDASGLEDLVIGASEVPRSMVSTETEVRALTIPQLRGPFKNRKRETVLNYDFSVLDDVDHHAMLELDVVSHGRAWVLLWYRSPLYDRWEYGYRHTLRAKDGERVKLRYPLRDLWPLQLRVEVVVQARSQPPELLGATLTEDLADEGDAITLVEGTTDSVTVDVDARGGPRMLSFLDAHYPGWEVTIDGEAAPLHVAMDAFKAVRVPEGQHRVTFTFSSSRLQIGVGIALLTALACLAALVLLRRRERATGAGSGSA